MRYALENGRERPKRCSKSDVFIRLCNKTRLGSVLENHGLDLFLRHLLSPIGLIFKDLSALRGTKIAQHGLQMGPFHLFLHPK